MFQRDVGREIEIRAAIALRSARTGLGWSQETAAQHSGLSKTAIARIETMVGQISLQNVYRLMDVYAHHGVQISDPRNVPLQVTFGPDALDIATQLLTDPSRKRSDAGKRRGKRKVEEAEGPPDASDEEGGSST